MKTTNTPVFHIVLVLLNVVSQFVNGQNWNSGDGDVKWQMDCDFPGHDINRIASPGENCGNLCIASPKCTHFRFAPDGFCHLKEAPLSTPVTKTGGGACGFIPWKFVPERDHWNSDKSSVKWLLNCDFDGHDISRIESTGDKCGDVCLANPECSHFRFDGKFCRIKKAPQSISRTAINGGACGFIPLRNFVIDKSQGNSGSDVGGFGSQCRINLLIFIVFSVIVLF